MTHGILGERCLLFITSSTTLAHQIIAYNTKPTRLHETISDKFLAASLGVICKMSRVKDI